MVLRLRTVKVWLVKATVGTSYVRHPPSRSPTMTALEREAAQFTRVEARRFVARWNRRVGRVRVFAVEREVSGPPVLYEPSGAPATDRGVQGGG